VKGSGTASGGGGGGRPANFSQVGLQGTVGGGGDDKVEEKARSSMGKAKAGKKIHVRGGGLSPKTTGREE